MKESLAAMQALLVSDAQMAAKELRYRSTKLYTRVASVAEAAYTGDETASDNVPAFLRRKAQEGRGRRG
ncbi:MAG: hypothetical protein ABIU58_05315 [Ramlibacter sp.]